MFQRVDKLRKNAFASMCVFGEDKANNISGIWVWRGQELAFPVSTYFISMDLGVHTDSIYSQVFRINKLLVKPLGKRCGDRLHICFLFSAL